MKKLSKTLLVLLATAAVVPSCKKGEGDPFMSFRSRDARITGEWTVSKYESTVTQNSNDKGKPTDPDYTVKNKTTAVKFDGKTETETITNNTTNYSSSATTVSNNTVTTLSTVTYELSLLEQGKAKLVETRTENSTTTTQSSTPANVCQTGGIAGITCDGTNISTVTTPTTSKKTNEGTWQWMSSEKNKEYIFISVGSISDIYYVKQLKNKEVILTKASVNDSSDSGDNNSTNSQKEEVTMTLTGK